MTSKASMTGSPLASLFHDAERTERGMLHFRNALIRQGNFHFLDSPEEEIYPFATPFFLPEGRYDALRDWTRRIVQALEALGRWLRRNPAGAQAHLLLSSSLDRAMFHHDPGMAEMVPIHRLDFAAPDDGCPQLLEINTGCPGGELDPALVAEAFFKSPLSRPIKESRYKTPLFNDPRDESLTNLLRIYHAFQKDHPALPDSPTIALVTSSGQAHFMVPECRGIAGHYEKRGFRTVVGDLLELKRNAGQVFLRHEPIHVIFRKFSTLSFRVRMEDSRRFGEQTCHRVRSIWKAVQSGEVCMVNPLGSTALQDKGLLQLLAERVPSLRAVIPETVILEPELPSLDPSLWEEVRHGQPFILKRRLSFAGRHIILDPAEVKHRAPELLQKDPGRWVAQRRLPLPRYPFAIWDGRQTRMGHFPFTISPFGRSCFVRTGWGGDHVPVGAHAGGAATCALLVRPR